MVTIFSVSPDFVASDYCYGEEALEAMSQYKERDARVIPVIIRSTQWENLIFGKLRCLPAGGKAVDMWQRKEEALANIAQGVRDSVEEIALKLRSAPHVADKTSPFWNVPHWRNPFFTGREDVLHDLKRTFDTNQSRVQAISGLPGVGKTQVATEYAYRNAQSYQAVLWANAESHELLISSFVRLAEVLKLPAQDDANQLIVVKAVQQWLQKNSRWLLILDNIEDLNLIQDFIPSVHSGHVLVTTRSHTTGNFARNVELRPMQIDDGVLLLPQAQACVRLIQQHNLLLPEASDFLLRTGSYLSERGLYDEADALLSQARTNSETLFGLDDIRVIPILNALATVYYKKGRYDLVESVTQRALALEEQLLGVDHPSIGETLQTLAGAYHRQGRFKEEEPLLLRALALRERVFGSRHSDVVTSMNSLANLYNGQGRYEQAETLYRQALAIWQQVLGPQHPKVALSLNNLAVLYSRQGLYEQAEPLAEQALQIYEQTLGSDHPDITSALDTLAVIYQERGKYAEAEVLYKRLFTIFNRVLGSEHPQLVVCYNNKALLYFLQKRYAEAEAVALRALNLGEKVSGVNHHRVGKSLNILADIYKAQDRYAEAEEFYQRALSIREESLGSNDINTARTLESYADLLQKMGRQDEAELMQQRATSIRNKRLSS